MRKSTYLSVVALFCLFLLFGAGRLCRAGENATITGDRANLRAGPASSGKRLGSIPKGTRVEALFVAGFSETIDGHAGSWCAVVHDKDTGFVFGRDIALDSGAIPTIEGPAYDGRRDRLFYFAETMRRLFGDTRADVRTSLGEPASVWEGGWGKCEGVKIAVLRYPEVEVELFYPTKHCGFATEQEFVSGVTISGGNYRILGIGVGSPVQDVIDALGWEYEDNAMRPALYDLRYVSDDHPQYVIDFIYKKTVKGDTVVRQEVTELRFSYNVLGD